MPTVLPSLSLFPSFPRSPRGLVHAHGDRRLRPAYSPVPPSAVSCWPNRDRTFSRLLRPPMAPTRPHLCVPTHLPARVPPEASPRSEGFARKSSDRSFRFCVPQSDVNAALALREQRCQVTERVTGWSRLISDIRRVIGIRGIHILCNRKFDICLFIRILLIVVA